MRICVVGTGYVGLVAAACLAEMGHRVVGVDDDEHKVDLLRSGGCPIYEPGLEDLLARHAGKRLRFSSSLEAVPDAEMIFLAVGTDQGTQGATDWGDLRRAAEGIAPLLSGAPVVVSKSTAPVGTGEQLRDLIAARCSPGVAFHMAVNPEFLRQGSAVADFLRPARVVIGADDETAAHTLSELYQPLQRPIYVTDMRSAELVKYAANAFLAVRVSFINCIADICERMGADIEAVIEALGADPRIGRQYLRPGLGFGGSCLPKDTLSLLHQAREVGSDCLLAEAAHAVNRERPRQLLDRLVSLVGDVAGQPIALLGLAFKGGTDDIRESRAMELARLLLDAGADLRAYDPAAMKRAETAMPELTCCDSAYDAATGARALIITADWDEFKQLDLSRLRAVMARPLVLDGCNLFSLEQAAHAGLEYHSIGRRSVPASG